MTGLQMYLAIAGVCLLLLLFLLNRFQELRHRNKNKLSQRKGQRTETLDPWNDEMEPSISLHSKNKSLSEESKVTVQHEDLSLLDEAIHPRFEWSVLFSADQDINGTQLWTSISSLPKLYGKAIWQLYETETKQWVSFDKEQKGCTYRYLRVVMPVSSRSGPLLEGRWQTIMTQLQEFATKNELIIKSSKDKNLFAVAKEVEDFCAHVDVMIGINIVFGDQSEVSMKGVREFIEEKGLLLGDDGLFHALNQRQEEIYSLGDRDQRPILDIDNSGITISGLTFIIDIPQIKDISEAITDAYTCASELVANFGGVIVDDNQKPLGIKQIESIEKRMNVIHQEMIAFGIVPGDVIAKKLFAM